MIEIKQRSNVIDDLVIVALRMLKEHVVNNGVVELNERLELSQFENTNKAVDCLDNLAIEINMDEKFIYDNNEPMLVGIHVEKGLVKGVLINKNIPIQVAAYDYDFSNTDEAQRRVINFEDGKARSVKVIAHKPSFSHELNISSLFSDGIDGKIFDTGSKIAENEYVESYSVVSMSTCHLTIDDRDAMMHGEHEHKNMILCRDTGFFLKLYNELELNYCEFMSPSLRKIIDWAFGKGFEMIEFDSDAAIMESFEVFDWVEKDACLQDELEIPQLDDTVFESAVLTAGNESVVRKTEIN